MQFAKQVVPAFHCNVMLRTQGKVIYCSSKSWPNQKVKQVTKDYSFSGNCRMFVRESVVYKVRYVVN